MTVTKKGQAAKEPSSSITAQLQASFAPTRPYMRDKTWLLLLAGLIALYAPVIVETARVWITDDYSTHGMLIPFMAGLLVWWRRQELAQAVCRPSAWGWLPLCAGLFLEVVAWYSNIRVFAMLSLVPVLLGLSLLFGGKRGTRILLFPILFLGFAAPLPTWLVQPVSFPIQNLSCQASCWSVQAIGVPIVREGFTVALPNGSAVEVANECSGFKKTLTVTVFACFYASLFAIAFWKQGLLVLAAAPLALLANIVRVSGLILAAHWWGLDGVHHLHDWADPFVVVVCFGMLLGVGRLLGCRKMRYFG